MLRIPSGQVTDQEGDLVEVTEEFFLCDREILVGQFQQFMKDPDYPVAEKPPYWRGVSATVSPTAEHPAQQISWYDAVMFCNWLSLKEGLTPCYQRTGEKDKGMDGKKSRHDAWRLNSSGNGYRLPTQAEWEYACRAGTSSRYFFGDDMQWQDAYAVHGTVGAEVCGTKRPNGWGLYDMHGNVFEWCNDAMNTGSRVVRGGSWGQSGRVATSSYFHGYKLDGRVSYHGFRVAIDSLPQQEGRRKIVAGKSTFKVQSPLAIAQLARRPAISHVNNN